MVPTVISWRVAKPTDTKPMKTSAHYRIGIDEHKRFSQVHVLADDGSTVWKGRIENNDPAAFEGLAGGVSP